jgi:hypothetical protein
MANRRVRVVRSVKLNGEWKFMNPQAAQRKHIPNNEGRWYITWREGTKKKWQLAESWTQALSLKLKKEGELAAVAAGVEIVAPNPARLKLDDAIEQFKDDLKLLERRDRSWCRTAGSGRPTNDRPEPGRLLNPPRHGTDWPSSR